MRTSNHISNTPLNRKHKFISYIESNSNDSHKNRHGAIYFFIILIFYKILLDISYSHIADVFHYQGLFFNNQNNQSYLTSWIMFFVFFPFFLKAFTEKTVSGNIVSLLTITSVIPSITVIGYRSDYPTIYNFLIMIFWFIFYTSWIFTKKIKISNFDNFQSRSFLYIVLSALCFSVILYSYINTGIRFHFSIIEVYDVREEARRFIAPFPLNYLVSLADNLLPFFVVYGIYKRNFLLSAIVIFVIYINFSIAGTKQIIFTLLFGIIGYYFINKLEFSYRLILGGIALLLIGIIESTILGSNVVNTLFPYRILFIPSELHYSYYSYFQSNDILYFSQSILKWLSPDNGAENIQFLLGEYAIGEYSARANNGLFSDAYMNLGIIGVVIYPVIIPLLLRVIDGSAEGLSESILFVIVVYISFVLLGMTLTSALLTSGLLFMILFLYSLPRWKAEN